MRKIYLNALTTALLILVGLVAGAQDSLSDKKPQMADAMHANGKIYVVVAVLIIILAGLFVYVMSLDRKISKIEK